MKKAMKLNGGLLEVSWWVAVVLKNRVAPLRCYVGQIQAKEEYGIRITCVDWISGSASGQDLYLPLESIESALVATDDHDLKMFLEAAAKWQEVLPVPFEFLSGDEREARNREVLDSIPSLTKEKNEEKEAI